MQDIRPASAEARAGVWDRSQPIVRVVSGLTFAEGPIWHPVERHLTFSDIPGNRILRLHRDGQVSTLIAPSNHANGNAYDPFGRMVTCEHATSRVVRRDADGATVIADRWQGAELNSPNDVIVARDGTVFFTDPPFGRQTRTFGGRRPIPQSVNGVYRVGVEGISLMAGDFLLPNGLCLSPDGKTIFIADTERAHIRRFHVLPDGRWSGGEVFADVPFAGFQRPDGLKCDADGNLLCSGAGGVHIFDATGRHIECIPVPELVANFAHGGDDMRTLYIAASKSIYTARLQLSGITAF